MKYSQYSEIFISFKLLEGPFQGKLWITFEKILAPIGRNFEFSKLSKNLNHISESHYLMEIPSSKNTSMF